MNPIIEIYFQLNFDIENKIVRLDPKDPNHIDMKKEVDKRKGEYEKWKAKKMKGLKK